MRRYKSQNNHQCWICWTVLPTPPYYSVWPVICFHCLSFSLHKLDKFVCVFVCVWERVLWAGLQHSLFPLHLHTPNCLIFSFFTLLRFGRFGVSHITQVPPARPVLPSPCAHTRQMKMMRQMNFCATDESLMPTSLLQLASLICYFMYWQLSNFK